MHWLWQFQKKGKDKETDPDFDMSDDELIKIITETANSIEMTQYKNTNNISCNDTMVAKQLVQQKKPSCPPQTVTNCIFSGNITINIKKIRCKTSEVRLT